MLEPVERIEPARLEVLPPEIADLAAEISAAAAVLDRALHPKTAAHLADLVRIMNSYYSNLLEGHNTRPREIERALTGRFDGQASEDRDLHEEAAAHVRVQAEIDHLAATSMLGEPTPVAFIRFLHERFYLDAPAAMLEIERGGRTRRMVPGAFRSDRDDEVSVGRHLPPSSHRVDAFMRHFERRYRFDELGRAGRIAAIAAAHHRLNYIHPFPDGNE